MGAHSRGGAAATRARSVLLRMVTGRIGKQWQPLKGRQARQVDSDGPRESDHTGVGTLW